MPTLQIECKNAPLEVNNEEMNLNPVGREKTNCTIFLGYTSNMISAGVRDSIRFLVQHNMVCAKMRGRIRQVSIRIKSPKI